MTKTTCLHEPASFRDPGGFIFKHENRVYRQVNQSYKEDFDLLISSGLFQALVDKQLLIAHEDMGDTLLQGDSGYKIIQPAQIDFISYPYEWCFSQLKAAALCTLSIQRTALDYGMVLKDASAYNIQFVDSSPIFIDTLSFERYQEGQPWVGYRQFCQHFLAPLALMALKDVRLNQLLKIYIDGVPLDMASKLLGVKTYFQFSLLTHIHMHAKSQTRHAMDATRGNKTISKAKVSKLGYIGIIESLTNAIKKLRWRPEGTEWADYYDATNYSDEATVAKGALVEIFLKEVKPKGVWDLGANEGNFSQIAKAQGARTISYDIDPSAVEKLFLRCQSTGESLIMPLLLDLTNPTGGIGWANNERAAFSQRGPVDVVMALALIHHLAISNNVPLQMVAQYFATICNHLIIEFVPKADSQVIHLLATREDVFLNYTVDGFEAAFGQHFEMVKKESIAETHRILYLMKTKNAS
jgi:hypothetical protein